jgi:hypothetical protein
MAISIVQEKQLTRMGTDLVSAGLDVLNVTEQWMTLAWVDQDAAAELVKAKILYISSSTILETSEITLPVTTAEDLTRSFVRVCWGLEANKSVVFSGAIDVGTADYGYGNVMSGSPGPSLTAGSAYDFNDGYTVWVYDAEMTTASLGAVLFRNGGAGNFRWRRFTRSGNTLTYTHDTADPITGMISPDIERMDDARLLNFYASGSDIYFRVVNISSDVTFGTGVILPTYTYTFTHANGGICRLSDNKGVAVLSVYNGTDREIIAFTVNISGNTVTSYGTAITLESRAAPAEPWYCWTSKIDANTVIVSYMNASNKLVFRTLSISGNTITDNGDDVTSSASVSIGTVGDEAISPLRVVRGYGIQVYLDSAGGNHYAFLIGGLPDASLARFYHGLNTLTEKFTLPFAGVQPGGMTLDRSLGTMVMGSNAPTAQPIIFSTYPYITGSSSSSGHPTGTAVTSIKWI